MACKTIKGNKYIYGNNYNVSGKSLQYHVAEFGNASPFVGGPPILAYSMTTQRDFNGSTYFDFDLTSNQNDLSKAVTVMMWANVSSSQSGGGGNQSGMIWNFKPQATVWPGPGISYAKLADNGAGNDKYGISGAVNSNSINLSNQYNTWVHFVWQRDRNDRIRAWLNGQSLGDYAGASGLEIGTLNCPHRLGYSIGSYVESYGYIYSMTGSVDDLYVYKNECYFTNTISIPSRNGSAPF